MTIPNKSWAAESVRIGAEALRLARDESVRTGIPLSQLISRILESVLRGPRSHLEYLIRKDQGGNDASQSD